MAANRIRTSVIVLALLSLACGGTVPWPPRAGNSPVEPSPEFDPVEVPGCGSLPGDIPVLEDATGASGYQGWCSYKTGADYPSAVEFYRAQLAAKHWNIVRTLQSDKTGNLQTHFYGE